ncbi:MAG TPA: FAD binding domain-containing protein, partial [Spirochaetales bacterium]|nr:FAD binding domain-containing protein [Spirochaetales bacterium]
NLAPGIERFAADVASPPIRARATLAGNIVNASPIADLTSMLLALGARLVLEGGPEGERLLELSDFFLGYKKTDIRDGERMRGILIPASPLRFNFEKAAKRARLDIATVNTAMAVTISPDGGIASVRASAGGVAPVPMRMAALEEAMVGKQPSAALAREAGKLAYDCGSPIGDVRGSAGYRRRLMERLTWAPFIRLWPELGLEKELLA